jgi:hypothetical protein
MSDAPIQLSVSIPCGICAGTIRLGEDRCATCGRYATFSETAALQRRWEAADPEAARRADRLQISRATIGILAGLWIVMGLLLWVVVDLSAAAFQLFFGAVFTVLFAASFRQPLFSVVSALVFYALGWLVLFIVDPEMGVSYVVGKTLTLLGLGMGCAAEFRQRRARRALAPKR